MRQEYCRTFGKWVPIVISINTFPARKGWTYDGYYVDNCNGEFCYAEFHWDVIHNSKPGTDKCDSFLADVMEASLIRAAKEQGLTPKKVSRLGNHIPKGYSYIGKD
jgi:hypothetical protein